MHTLSELQERQSLPLNLKIAMTKRRIRDWISHYGVDGVYVSFSGGKDSTVLLDIVREEFPTVKAMFVDVPTQYPELKQFVKTFKNVDIVTPKVNFFQVCEKYGFPLFSKEISECVEGARKYLTSILNEKAHLTDRQTDRPYKYWFDRVCGQGKYAKSDRGGYDRKYRRIRGIGEFVERTEAEPQGRQQPTISNHVGNVCRERRDQGEYP